VEDIRRDDLHNDGEADLVGKLESLIDITSKLGASNGEVVSSKELLGLGLSQAAAAILASTLDDFHGLGLGVLGVGEGNEFVTLTSLEDGDLAESRKSAKSLLGIVVHGDRNLKSKLLASFLTLNTTDEASHERLVLLLLGSLGNTSLDSVSNFRGLGGGGLAVENSDSVNPRMVESDLNAVLVTLGTSRTSDIDRVLGAAERRHALVKSVLKILRSSRKRNAVDLSSIRRKNTDTTTVGDNESVLTAHRRLHGKSLTAIKHLIKIHSTDNLSLIESSIVDLHSTSKRTSVRSSSGSTTSRNTTLKSNDRLARLATSLDEGTTVLKTFNVQGDTVGVRILSIVVDGISKVNITHVTERNHGAASKLTDESSTIKSDKKSTRLGHKSSVTTIREARSKGSIGIAAVKKKTNDVRAKNTTTTLMSDLYKFFLFSIVTNFRETRSDNDVTLNLLGSSLTSTANNKLGRNSIDCKVNFFLRNLSDILVGLKTTNLRSIRIDRVYLTSVFAVNEVLNNSVTNATNLSRGTDDCNALRGKDLIHLESLLFRKREK